MNENSISRIFIVEDDTALGDSLAAIFDLKGYSVRLFENASLALSCFLEGDIPNLIVIDGDLPGMKGPDGIIKIRDAGFDGDFVGMSAGEYRNEMLLAGASSYWEKPFEIPDFLKAIEGLTANIKAPRNSV